MAGRGVDGLTAEELRSSRDEWWDAAFSRVLLDAIPTAAHTLVDLGCGLARAGHELLPQRARLRYVGIDLDAARLGQAAAALSAAHGARAQLVGARAEAIPLADETVDVVLTSMTLQHVPDLVPVLAEVRRVLAPDGVIVSAEPDNPAMRTYFDEPLDEINATFAALYAAQRVARLPADIAVGPRVPAMLRAAGFREVDARVHAVQGGGYRRVGKVAADLLQLADILRSIGGPSCTGPAAACADAVGRWRDRLGEDTRGHHAWLIPVFVSHGRR